MKEELKSLIDDLRFELKKRAINAKETVIANLLMELNIKSTTDLVKYYGYKTNIYNLFSRDYLNKIFN